MKAGDAELIVEADDRSTGIGLVNDRVHVFTMLVCLLFLTINVLVNVYCF